jgi:hypothetical protein
MYGVGMENEILIPMILGMIAAWYLLAMPQYRKNKSVKELVWYAIAVIVGFGTIMYFNFM